MFLSAIGSISAGNDEIIGTMIADAIDKVGPDGVLSIESSSSFETTVDVEEGMEVCISLDDEFAVKSSFSYFGPFIIFSFLTSFTGPNVCLLESIHTGFHLVYRSIGVISPHSL